MHRAGPGERGGASYGRRAVATAKWAVMQISVARKGLRYICSNRNLFKFHAKVVQRHSITEPTYKGADYFGKLLYKAS